MNLTSTVESFPRPVVLAIASAGGVGFLRPASGTWGSLVPFLVALPMALLCPQFGPASLAVVAVVATVLGLLTAGLAARLMGRGDPSQVVIDEVAGQAVTLALLPAAVWQHQAGSGLLLGFVLFRVFDIAKPWPIGWLERLPGSLGIMADDLAAGLVAGLITGALLS